MIFFQMNYPTHKTTLSYFAPTEYSHPICLTRSLLFPIGQCGIIQICGDQFSWIWVFLLIRRDYFLYMRVFSHAVKKTNSFKICKNIT